VKKSSWKTSVIFECLDCGKQFQSMNGQGLAAQHAKKYKHYVTGEVCVASKYDGHKD
jgi:hypothetical protein